MLLQIQLQAVYYLVWYHYKIQLKGRQQAPVIGHQRNREARSTCIDTRREVLDKQEATKSTP